MTLSSKDTTLATIALSAVTMPYQITDKDVIGWIVSLLSVLIAAIGLIYAALAFNRDSNARYAEALIAVEKQVSEVETDPGRNEKKSTLAKAGWERRFLNVMNRIAFLVYHRIYPAAFTDYFQFDFQWAMFIIQNGESPDEYAKSCPETLGICAWKGWVGRDRS